MMLTREKLQLVKNKRFLEVTLANKTVASTGKNCWFILGIDKIISMHEYVYKCAVVISN